MPFPNHPKLSQNNKHKQKTTHIIINQSFLYPHNQRRLYTIYIPCGIPRLSERVSAERAAAVAAGGGGGFDRERFEEEGVDD